MVEWRVPLRSLFKARSPAADDALLFKCRIRKNWRSDRFPEFYSFIFFKYGLKQNIFRLIKNTGIYFLGILHLSFYIYLHMFRRFALFNALELLERSPVISVSPDTGLKLHK